MLTKHGGECRSYLRKETAVNYYSIEIITILLEKRRVKNIGTNEQIFLLNILIFLILFILSNFESNFEEKRSIERERNVDFI